ncbi:unnamed protein product [Mytilus coruscus]|uniref:Uncharacterized protein n=1 Tax=Mytilus coruscus TaxID=42192 RepID=A0A6J8EYY8_MYTCO|nr:unnamed protein product [Mytilus coruscus]
MMNENSKQEETGERKRTSGARYTPVPFKRNIQKPKPKDPKRVAAGKKGAEAKKMKAELRKKEEEKLKKENAKFKMASEKSDLPQITKDSDTETDCESNPSVERNSGSKVDYKFALFSIGIVGLGLFFYSQSKKPEKMIKEIVVGKEITKPEKPEKQKKEIDPFEFN